MPRCIYTLSHTTTITLHLAIQDDLNWSAPSLAIYLLHLIIIYTVVVILITTAKIAIFFNSPNLVRDFF